MTLVLNSAITSLWELLFLSVFLLSFTFRFQQAKFGPSELERFEVTYISSIRFGYFVLWLKLREAFWNQKKISRTRAAAMLPATSPTHADDKVITIWFVGAYMTCLNWKQMGNNCIPVRLRIFVTLKPVQCFVHNWGRKHHTFCHIEMWKPRNSFTSYI